MTAPPALWARIEEAGRDAARAEQRWAAAKARLEEAEAAAGEAGDGCREARRALRAAVRLAVEEHGADTDEVAFAAGLPAGAVRMWTGRE